MIVQLGVMAGNAESTKAISITSYDLRNKNKNMTFARRRFGAKRLVWRTRYYMFIIQTAVPVEDRQATGKVTIISEREDMF